jgi:peroxiredoxin
MQGQAAPNFSLASTDGKTSTLSAQRGAPRVGDFVNEKILFPFERLSLDGAKVRGHAQEVLNFVKAL